MTRSDARSRIAHQIPVHEGQKHASSLVFGTGPARHRTYACAIAERAFPVVFAAHVARSAAFYEALGFERHFQLPPEGEPGYIGLRRGHAEIGVVSADWPEQQYRLPIGTGVRFEMFVYVDDVDRTVGELRTFGSTVLREPRDMPWGERVAYLTDPDGNPVAVAARPLG